jgi:aryl-alcohol dehydrogenase-like predicted oxidoreductase
MSTLTPTDQDTLLAPMPTRELRGLGWNASLLTLGGVKWDSQIPEADAIELLHRALELGVNTFDTAAVYNAGESERRLGKALEGQRDSVWINTKVTNRGYNDAKRDIENSLKHLRTDRIDLMFVHSIEDDADVAKVLGPDSSLRAIEEFREAGHIRHVGVSGHWFKHNMARIIDEYPFEAVLLPAGLFNEAYGYSYLTEVVPAARAKGLCVMGMKILGAGRAKHAADVTPYLRYAIHQDIDTAVIGCDSIAQLEQTVRIVKSRPAALPQAEAESLFDEAKRVTQTWDAGEFNWVSHYV